MKSNIKRINILTNWYITIWRDNSEWNIYPRDFITPSSYKRLLRMLQSMELTAIDEKRLTFTRKQI